MGTTLIFILLTLHGITHASQANQTIQQPTDYQEPLTPDNYEPFCMEPKNTQLPYPDADCQHQCVSDTFDVHTWQESEWLPPLEMQQIEEHPLPIYATDNILQQWDDHLNNTNAHPEPNKNELNINCLGVEFGNHLSDDENIKNLQKLIALRKQSTTFSCCTKTDLHWVEYTDHLNSHHCIGDNFVCPNQDCKKKYTQLTKAYHHAATHQEPTLFNCPLCGHKANTIATLNTHFKICLRPKSSDAMSLSTFLKSQTKKYLHTCHSVASQATFKSWKSVKLYISKNYKEARSQYSCPMCKKKKDNVVMTASCFVKHWCSDFFVCPVCLFNCGDYQHLKSHDISRCTRTPGPAPETNTIQDTVSQPATTIVATPAASHEEQIQKHIDETIAKITCCKMPLGNWFSAQNHFALRHKIKTMCYAYPHCTCFYKTSAQALECYLAEHNKRIFACRFCEKIIGGRQKLIDHIVTNCNKAPTPAGTYSSNTNASYTQ